MYSHNCGNNISCIWCCVKLYLQKVFKQRALLLVSTSFTLKSKMIVHRLTSKQESLVSRYISRAFDATFYTSDIIDKYSLPQNLYRSVNNFILAHVGRLRVHSITLNDDENHTFRKFDSFQHDIAIVKDAARNILSKKKRVTVEDLLRDEDFSGNYNLLSNYLKRALFTL